MGHQPLRAWQSSGAWSRIPPPRDARSHPAGRRPSCAVSANRAACWSGRPVSASTTDSFCNWPPIFRCPGPRIVDLQIALRPSGPQRITTTRALMPSTCHRLSDLCRTVPHQPSLGWSPSGDSTGPLSESDEVMAKERLWRRNFGRAMNAADVSFPPRLSPLSAPLADPWISAHWALPVRPVHHVPASITTMYRVRQRLLQDTAGLSMSLLTVSPST